MSLFQFFKKASKTGRDSTVKSSELIEEDLPETENDERITTNLSISPDWDISLEQEYVLKFLSNDLPPLKPNQISLSGIDVSKNQDTNGLNVQAFVRSSLNKPINLKKAELLLLDAENKTIAAQEFDLSKIGSLPPNSNRPWIFEFDLTNVKVDEIPSEQWSLAFNVQSLVPHSLDLEPAWKESLSDAQKSVLDKLVKSLPALKPQELNITGFQSTFTKEGNLAVSVFIRSGHTKQIQLEKLPLEVLDATGNQVAKGAFTLDNLTVKPNTSKPWTFVYPKEMLLIEDPDLTKWTARIAK